MVCHCFACSVRDFFIENTWGILLFYTIFKSLLLIYRQATESTNLILDFRLEKLEKFVDKVRENLPDDFGDI